MPAHRTQDACARMEATFIIVREDLQVDPVTIVAEGVLIGRLPTCELLLNHPSVSRLHAGVTYADGEYYVRNLRPGNPILLNATKLEEYEALADGDVLGIGPFALNVTFAQGSLTIKVSLQPLLQKPPDTRRKRSRANRNRLTQARRLSTFFGTSESPRLRKR
ncbi:MAG: hypothetical protein DMF72_07640 [Acidobacteria bacterium]|nr:MAG: hypothetical protein DMF72_07640 [Acidobacteriota bacterium]